MKSKKSLNKLINKSLKLNKSNKPVRSSQVPATASMLFESEERLIHRMDAGFERLSGETRAAMADLKSDMRTELKSEIHSVKTELRSEIHSVKTELKSDILSLRTELKSDILGVKNELKSEIHGIKSELHRVALLVEEQNARNKFVMDGYAQIYELLTTRAESPG